MENSDARGGASEAPEGETTSGARRFRVLAGGGQRKEARLASRHDLAGVLVGAAADLLLRRISAPRAHEIERRVERLMDLFDRVEAEPLLDAVLRRELDGLECLVRETPRRAWRGR